MMTEEQIQALLDAAKGEDPSKFKELLEARIQERATAAVAEQVEGLKAKNEELLGKLKTYSLLGKPDELATKLKEIDALKTAAENAKGGKVDPKELDKLAEEVAKQKIATWQAEEDAAKTALTADRDQHAARAQKLLSTLRRHAIETELFRLAGPDVKGPLWRYFVDTLEANFQEPEMPNGGEWWEPLGEGKPVRWRIVDSTSDRKHMLVGKSGPMTPAELVESSRQGLGDKPWSSAETRDTFFEPKGKGGGARTVGDSTQRKSLGADASSIELISSGLAS